MWLTMLMSLLTSIPTIVTGIERVHGDAKSGVAKKQLAMEALGLASGIGPVILPGNAAQIAAATKLASSTIDGVVEVMNAGNPANAARVSNIR